MLADIDEGLAELTFCELARLLDEVHIDGARATNSWWGLQVKADSRWELLVTQVLVGFPEGRPDELDDLDLRAMGDHTFEVGVGYPHPADVREAIARFEAVANDTCGATFNLGHSGSLGG